MENLGRHLVFVKWENGMDTPVFIDEIELCGDAIPMAA
jgi:hypothetical protein